MADDNQTTTQTSTDNADAFSNKLNTNTDTSTTTPNTDQVFQAKVGEGKQYATVEDLAKGKLEADAFIEQLKEENRLMREDLSKRPTLDDIQDIMKLQNDTQSTPSPELNEEALSTIVQSQLQEMKTKDLEAGNVAQASNKMVELYGEKASEQVAIKANELGVTVQYLEGIAAKSPKMFFSTMGIETNTNNASSQSVASNQTAQGNNTEQFSNMSSTPKDGTWNYYEQLRKEDPVKYFSPKVQNELFQARKSKEADFYK